MTTTQTAVSDQTISKIAQFINAIQLSKSADPEIGMFGKNMIWTIESNLRDAGLTDEQIETISKAVR